MCTRRIARMRTRGRGIASSSDLREGQPDATLANAVLGNPLQRHSTDALPSRVGFESVSAQNGRTDEPTDIISQTDEGKEGWGGRDPTPVWTHPPSPSSDGDGGSLRSRLGFFVVKCTRVNLVVDDSLHRGAGGGRPVLGRRWHEKLLQVGRRRVGVGEKWGPTGDALRHERRESRDREKSHRSGQGLSVTDQVFHWGGDSACVWNAS